MFARVQSKLIVVTPVLDTNIYASGDMLGSIQVLTNAMPGDGYLATLASLTVVDAANQKSAIDLLFFNALPTVASADNAAISITDAELQAKCIGMLSILSTDWTTITSGSNAVASLKTIGLLLRAKKLATQSGGWNLPTTLYVVAVSRGTPTYGAGDLTFSYGIYED